MAKYAYKKLKAWQIPKLNEEYINKKEQLLNNIYIIKRRFNIEWLLFNKFYNRRTIFTYILLIYDRKIF